MSTMALVTVVHCSSSSDSNARLSLGCKLFVCPSSRLRGAGQTTPSPIDDLSKFIKFCGEWNHCAIAAPEEQSSDPLSQSTEPRVENRVQCIDPNWHLYLSPQLPRQFRPDWCSWLPAHRAGHSQNPSQDHWHRRNSLCLQEPALQVRH